MALKDEMEFHGEKTKKVDDDHLYIDEEIIGYVEKMEDGDQLELHSEILNLFRLENKLIRIERPDGIFLDHAWKSLCSPSYNLDNPGKFDRSRFRVDHDYYFCDEDGRIILTSQPYDLTDKEFSLIRSRLFAPYIQVSTQGGWHDPGRCALFTVSHRPLTFRYASQYWEWALDPD